MSPTPPLLLILLLAAVPAQADAYRAAARRLCRAAAAAGLERVAVFPLMSLDDASAREGVFLAERLSLRMSRCPGLRLVERTLLDDVLGEQRLGLSGAVDARQALKLGRMVQAQAAVVGSVASIGDTAEMTVRLIRVETGEVLAAARGRIRNPWLAGRGPLPSPAPIRPEEAAAEALAFQRGECDGAAQRIDYLEAGVLGLKARYWAGELRRRGLEPEHLGPAPGAPIQDPALRARFQELLLGAAASGAPTLTLSEILEFTAADGKAHLLHRRCLGGVL